MALHPGAHRAGTPYPVTHTTLHRVGSLSYHGPYSGLYYVYSVPGVPVALEVAMDARQGYLKAIRVSAPAR